MSQTVFFFGVQSYASNTDNSFRLNAAFSIMSSIVALLLCQGFFVYLFEESNKQRPIFSFLKGTIFYPFHLVFLYYFATVLYTLTLSLSFTLYVAAVGSLFPLLYHILNSPYPKSFSLPYLDSLFKCVMTVICMGILIMAKTQE